MAGARYVTEQMPSATIPEDSHTSISNKFARIVNALGDIEANKENISFEDLVTQARLVITKATDIKNILRANQALSSNMITYLDKVIIRSGDLMQLNHPAAMEDIVSFLPPPSPGTSHS